MALAPDTPFVERQVTLAFGCSWLTYNDGTNTAVALIPIDRSNVSNSHERQASRQGRVLCLWIAAARRSLLKAEQTEACFIVKNSTGGALA